MASKMHPVITAALIVCVASGCATGPAPRWKSPTASEVRDQNQTLDYGRAYAAKARRAYQAAIDREVKGTTDTGSALILLGAGLIGAGIFGAHRDTLITGGLLGGTGLALNQWNSAKPRLPLYQAGIEGFNCAESVVVSLSMSDTDFKSLTDGLANIETAMSDVQNSMTRTKALLDTLAARQLRRELVTDAERALQTADLALQSGTGALDSGRKLAQKVRAAGAELVGAINRIDAEVQNAALSTIPDISAVKSIIAGLPASILDFAPRPGIRDSMYDAFAKPKVGAAPQARSGSVSADEEATLRNEIIGLNGDVRRLNTSVARVRSHVNAYDPSVNTSALKNCKASDIVLPLNTVPDILVFSGAKDQRLPIIVSGGKPQYNATIEPPDSFSVSGPGGGRVFNVTAMKALESETRAVLTITDSTDPKRSEIIIPIVVTVSGSAPPPAPPSATPTLAQLATALNEAGTVPLSDKQSVKVAAREDTSKGIVNVTVTCTPSTPDGGPLASNDVRDKLLQAEKVLPIATAFLKADSKGKDKIVVESIPPECVKASPAPQKRRAGRVRR